MRMQFFGDSYDIVKKFLIRSLAPDAEWVAFPMFSHEVTSRDVEALEKFLGVRVASENVITASTNRAQLLSAPVHHRHIFIDPDTGIRLRATKGSDSAKYIFGPELVTLCGESPERLLLVFDQSVPRGGERRSIDDKLRYFQKKDIFGFAYLSHACFVVLSASGPACEEAYDRLLDSGLPASRLFTGGNAQHRPIRASQRSNYER
jgi:hypothetical protein